MPYTTCVLCNRKLKVHQRRPVNKTIAKYLRKNFLLETSKDDFICGKCGRPAYRTTSTNQSQILEEPTETNTCQSPPSVKLNIPSASKSHSYCFVCKKPGPKLVVVPSKLRSSAFLQYNVLITSQSRCCPCHLDESFTNFKPGIVSSLKTLDHSYLNKTSILELLQNLRQHVLQSTQKRMCFENMDTFTDSELVTLTGLNKEHFTQLHQHLDIQNTSTRNSLTSLGLFLFKMRSGLSNNLLSTLFDISKSSVRRAIHAVRQTLMQNFVPANLGFRHITRGDVITQHTRKLTQSLLAENNNQAILVLDGTYIYIQKSNNFHFQRRSYSIHKGRPLVKPMVIVSTTGYFISVFGPYFADSKNNDASILNHIIRNNLEDIKNWISPEDIFVVDRGFRDSIELLEDIGIQAKIPAFMKPSEKQMSTEDSNASRLVTKVRWVVEAANSRIKQWKYLCHILPTNQVPFIGDYVRIVCAISNKFYCPLNSSQDEDETTANQMLERLTQTNQLKTYIESNGLDKRSVKQWSNVHETSLNDFPVLNETTLRILTLGTYQLKLSDSYMQEFIGGEGDILLCKEDPNLLRIKLQSRHVSSKSYYVWIRYDSDNILAWYCKCRAGARTVGTCSHVAAVLWYLGTAIHSGSVQEYGVKDWGEFLEDAAYVPQVVDCSDSEESTVEE